MHKGHERALEALARRGRRRELAAASGFDFASNDYLGLASSRELREAAQAAIAREVPIGAGGSRLLRGNHREHEALEAEAAAFFGAGRHGGYASASRSAAGPPLHLVLVNQPTAESSRDGRWLRKKKSPL